MDMRKPSISFIALLFLALSSSFVAAQSKAETPEEFSIRYMAVLKAGDWRAAALLLHPEAREKLKTILGEFVAVDTSGAVAKTLFRLKTNEEFRALSSEDVYERFMEGLIKTHPTYGQVLKNMQTRIIGHVAEAPDLAYVLYRSEMIVSGATISKYEVMPLKTHNDAWLALLSGDMENLTQLLRNPPSSPPPPTRKPARKTKPN
jgi:hypothetical protein